MPEHSSPASSAKATAEALQRHIHTRTCGRIRQLRVHWHGGGVAIHGVASSYHVKQLAICAVREVVPAAAVELHIQVP
jgi:hypothetical protein